jgi:hypothetical protein
MSPVIVRVSRRFDAAPERVFDAWLAEYAKPAESGWTMVLAALDRHLA